MADQTDQNNGTPVPINANIPPVLSQADLVKDTSASEAEKFLSAGTVNIEYADLSQVNVPKEILNLIPEHIARKFQAVPISLENNALNVAMVDPQDVETIELIKRKTGYAVKPKLCTTDDVGHILDQYSGFQADLEDAISDADLGVEKKQEIKQVDEEPENENAPTARIVYSLLKKAVREKASDIHIEPDEKEVIVRFRLDGILHKKVTLPKEIQAAVASRLKILANLKIDEQRLPQDGRIQLIIDRRDIDFRMSTIPVVTGEKIVLRILDKSVGILTLDQLGLRGESRKTLDSAVSKSHGMTLVTGPTGSGKTTTLYALLTQIMNPGVNVLTIEDPVEYRMAGVNQSQINADIGYTFANGLRAIVRQDPNIIMVGEIRDKETAEMGIQASLTGHIVLSTLHTNDAAGAIPRLIDMAIEPFLITSSINTVVGQRLARQVCQDCKQKVAADKSEEELVNKIISEMPEIPRKEVAKKEIAFYRGKGCDLCQNTGYKGRIGIFEVLEINETVKKLALERVSGSVIQKQAVADGMITMIQDGILKALDGLTTLEEVWRVTKE
ncbi:MAG: GspE/PulE family protein [Patescibacteria group bacterium]|jgi:type IV pilus assembly protein PilB